MVLNLILGLLVSFQVMAADSFSKDTFSQLKPLKGVSEISTKKAKKRLVYFWAEWCPDCKEKLGGDLGKLDSSPEVDVITINTDRDVNRAEHYMARENLKLPVYTDPQKAFRKPLKVFSVPHWAVMSQQADGSWKVVDTQSGSDFEKLQKALKGNG